MNTSRSPAYDCIRTRSPSSAPPVIGDDGSTATTATDRPAARTSPISAATSVDLPAPGGPVIPTMCAPPGQRVEPRGAPAPRRASGSRPRSGAAPAPAGRRATRGVGEARSPARVRRRRRSAHASRAAGVGPEVLGDLARSSCPGPKTAATPASVRAAMSSSGMIPPAVTRTSSRPSLAEQLRDPRQERHVGARQDRQADDVDVLLERRGRDHLGCLAEAGVDDLEPLVAEAPREDLRAAIVAVEAGLGDQDLDRAVGHGPIVPRARPLPAGCG